MLLLGLVLLSSCGVYNDKIDVYNNKISVLKLNWNIDLPQPLNVINVASNVSGFPADGITYSILEYNDETINELKKLSYWGSAGSIIRNGITDSLRKLEESSEVPAKQ